MQALSSQDYNPSHGKHAKVSAADVDARARASARAGAGTSARAATGAATTTGARPSTGAGVGTRARADADATVRFSEAPHKKRVVVRPEDWNGRSASAATSSAASAGVGHYAAPTQAVQYSQAPQQILRVSQQPSRVPQQQNSQIPQQQTSQVSQQASQVPQQASKRRIPRWAKVLLALLALALAAAALFAAYLGNIMSLGDKAQETKEALAPTLGNEPFYMLVTGTDSRSQDPDVQGRADVIMLLRIDPKNSLVTAVSIPRDTPWTDTTGRITKINEASMQGGAPTLIGAVQELTGVHISHYAEVDYSGFADIVDALGGITVEVPITVGYKDAYTSEYIEVPAGVQELNGQQATILARARHEYGADQEAQRQSMVRTILQAMLDKAKNVPIQNLPAVATTVAECVDTDVSMPSLATLLPSFLDEATYYSASGPHAGDIDDAAEGQWLCFENPDGWARLMSIVNAGEDPSGISYDEDYVTVAGTGAPPA